MLGDAERERLQKYRSPLTFALEALYRLWLEKPQSRMTLHDQLAVAEAAAHEICRPMAGHSHVQSRSEVAEPIQLRWDRFVRGAPSAGIRERNLK